MKKQIKFNAEQSALISKSIEDFKNDTLKNVAQTHFGGLSVPPSHSKGVYQQAYSKYAAK